MVKRENIAVDPDGGARHPRVWSNLTYTTRLTVSFAAIAAMTALVAIGVLSFVWEQHFQSYTMENQRDVASKVAVKIANQYAKTGSFYNEDGTLNESVIKPAEDQYYDSSGVGIAVFEKGNPEPLWFSTLDGNPESGKGTGETEANGQAQVPDESSAGEPSGEGDEGGQSAIRLPRPASPLKTMLPIKPKRGKRPGHGSALKRTRLSPPKPNGSTSASRSTTSRSARCRYGCTDRIHF